MSFLRFFNLPSYGEIPSPPPLLSTRQTSHATRPPPYHDVIAPKNDPTKPETIEKLLAEVRVLAGSVKKVDEAFERVGMGLAAVDDINYRDRNGDLQNFQLTWLNFQKRWEALLWESHDAATATETNINVFLGVIIPIVEDVKTEEDRKAALNDIKGFLERDNAHNRRLYTTESHSAAVKLSQAYINLERDMDAFACRFDAFTEGEHAKLSSGVTQIDAKLAYLRDEIHRCRLMVAGLAAIAILMVGVGVGTFLVISSAWAAALSAALATGLLAVRKWGDALMSFFNKYKDLEAESKKCQEELDTLREQLGHLAKLKHNFESQKADMNEIAEGLDQFATVWKQVTHDAKIISNHLEVFVHANEQSEKTFRSRVALIKSRYTALGIALGEYTTQICLSKVQNSKIVQAPWRAVINKQENSKPPPVLSPINRMMSWMTSVFP